MLLKSAHAIITPRAKIATIRAGKDDHFVTRDSKSVFGMPHTRKSQFEKAVKFAIKKINYDRVG